MNTFKKTIKAMLILFALSWMLPAKAETEKTPNGGAILTQEEVS